MPHTLLPCNSPGAHDTYHIHCFRNTPTFCFPRRNNTKTSIWRPCDLPASCYWEAILPMEGCPVGGWTLTTVDVVPASRMPEQGSEFLDNVTIPVEFVQTVISDVTIMEPLEPLSQITCDSREGFSSCCVARPGSLWRGECVSPPTRFGPPVTGVRHTREHCPNFG